MRTALFHGSGSVRGAFCRISPHGAACAGTARPSDAPFPGRAVPKSVRERHASRKPPQRTCLSEGRRGCVGDGGLRWFPGPLASPRRPRPGGAWTLPYGSGRGERPVRAPRPAAAGCLGPRARTRRAGDVPVHTGAPHRGHGSRTGRGCTGLVRTASDPSAKSPDTVRQGLRSLSVTLPVSSPPAPSPERLQPRPPALPRAARRSHSVSGTCAGCGGKRRGRAHRGRERVRRLMRGGQDEAAAPEPETGSVKRPRRRRPRGWAPSPRLRSRGVVWYQDGRVCTVGSTNGERLRSCTIS